MNRPSYQFYPADHLADPALGRCCPATRGVWWDLQCAMWKNEETGELTGRADELARCCRCSPEEMRKALAELQKTGAADVTITSQATHADDEVTVTCRRMHRDWNERNSHKQRQSRYRQRKADATHSDSDAEVTPYSSSSTSSSTSVKTPKPPPKAGAKRAVPDLWFDDAFWPAYPKKAGKKKAKEAFAKLKPGDTLKADMMAALDRHKQSEQWTKEGGKFIPHCPTWLNDRRWEDELQPATNASGSNDSVQATSSSPNAGMMANRPATPRRSNHATLQQAELQCGDESASDAWRQARDALAKSIDPDVFTAFIKEIKLGPSELSTSGGSRFTLGVPTPFVAQRAAHYRDEIAEAFEAVVGHPVAFDFAVIECDEAEAVTA